MTPAREIILDAIKYPEHRWLPVTPALLRYLGYGAPYMIVPAGVKKLSCFLARTMIFGEDFQRVVLKHDKRKPETLLRLSPRGLKKLIMALPTARGEHARKDFLDLQEKRETVSIPVEVPPTNIYFLRVVTESQDISPILIVPSTPDFIGDIVKEKSMGSPWKLYTCCSLVGGTNMCEKIRQLFISAKIPGTNWYNLSLRVVEWVCAGEFATKLM